MRQTILAVAVIMVATPLAAQTSPQVTNDLTENMHHRQHRVCKDRPARPSWMGEVHPREAYRAITLTELYEIRAWEGIAVTGDCSCDVRFPAWESSDAEYQEAYANLSQTEHSALRRNLIETRKQLEPVVRKICEAQGSW